MFRCPDGWMAVVIPLEAGGARGCRVCGYRAPSSIWPRPVPLRIEQDQGLKALLLRHKGKKFYEATYNTKYGAGITLRDARQGTIKVADGYQNRMGRINEELIEEISDK